MSLRRFKYHIHGFKSFVYSLRFPSWTVSTPTKVIAGILLIVVGVGYVMQTSALATSGYEIHTLEQQVASLTNEVQRLNSEVASAGSMTNIQKRLPEVKMVSMGKVSYLKASSEIAVARR